MKKNNRKYVTILFCLSGMTALLFLTARDSRVSDHFTSIAKTEKNYFPKADSTEATAILQKQINGMKKSVRQTTNQELSIYAMMEVLNIQTDFFWNRVPTYYSIFIIR